MMKHVLKCGTILRCAAVAMVLFALSGCTHTAGEVSQRKPMDSKNPTEPTIREVAPEHVPTPPSEREPFLVRMKYVETSGGQQFSATENLVITTNESGLKRLPAGQWRVTQKKTGGARYIYPVYVQGFEHHETALLRDVRQGWRDKGYSTFVTTLGRAVTSTSGEVYDGRKYWLGIKRCASEAEAEGLKKTLRGEKVWAWTRAEIHTPTQGVLSFHDTTGKVVLTTSSPVRIRTTGIVALHEVKKGKDSLNVPAPLEFGLSPSGKLAVYGDLQLEYYLQGILPAEMYPDWPLEALKAQAVAARSEILVHAGGKHSFEGFDFCIEQHCRAFAGEEGHQPRTDQAVLETRDHILVNKMNAIVPTVFSANCGGWTEHNENVWDGAPDAALRGHSDHAHGQESNESVASWLNDHPAAYCSHDGRNYRWTRSIALGDLSKRLDASYGIGSLKSVEGLERGVSGRLKAVRVVGSRKTVEIRKELNIRRAFDNLPSALCTINVDRKSGVVRVRGAGRGHGVGLCQQGAFGMAQDNKSYDVILCHYFAGVHVSKI